MSSPVPTGFTEAEYLALERASDRKHEYIDGAIVAMAGARPPHNQLAANVTSALVVLCRGGPCAKMTSDQRVHVPKTRLYTYPDVTVACDERRYDAGEPPSLLNPTAIVEVTSDSTEDFDRGTKFIHYQSITELMEYLIVSHRERRIDHFHRLDDGHWHLATYVDEDVLNIPFLGGSIRLSDVYQGVNLSEGK